MRSHCYSPLAVSLHGLDHRPNRGLDHLRQRWPRNYERGKFGVEVAPFVSCSYCNGFGGLTQSGYQIGVYNK